MKRLSERWMSMEQIAARIKAAVERPNKSYSEVEFRTSVYAWDIVQALAVDLREGAERDAFLKACGWTHRPGALFK